MMIIAAAIVVDIEMGLCGSLSDISFVSLSTAWQMLEINVGEKKCCCFFLLFFSFS